MNHLFRSIQRSAQQRGIRGAAVAATVALWRRAFRHRQLVYELSSEAASALPQAPPSGSHIHVLRDSRQMPEVLRRSLAVRHGEAFVQRIDQAFDQGAVLFLLELDNEAVSLLWAKSGDRVTRWYLPLSRSDVALYGWWTTPEKRGQGLIRHLIAAATRAYSPDARRFLADVRVWNTPSIRAMERVGFRYLIRTRPR